MIRYYFCAGCLVILEYCTDLNRCHFGSLMECFTNNDLEFSPTKHLRKYEVDALADVQHFPAKFNTNCWPIVRTLKRNGFRDDPIYDGWHCLWQLLRNQWEKVAHPLNDAKWLDVLGNFAKHFQRCLLLQMGYNRACMLRQYQTGRRYILQNKIDSRV